MYLASIYIKDHFLFNKPLTINFGGRYIYDFSNIFGIKRKENDKFIDNFYSFENLELVSAIVGKNGTGKTTLLRDIINFLNGNGYGYDYIIFLENNHITYKIKSSIVHGTEFNTIAFDKTFDTLYYSPYLDFKDSIEGIDLSYDAVMEGDFNDAENKYFENNKINYNRWLKARNSIRILEFQSSKYSFELNSFFDFPEIQRARVSFIRHKIDVDNHDIINFHNTPFDLQPYIQSLYSLISKEGTRINANRPKGYSHVNLQKELFKNYIIMDVLCLLILQMEKTNQYLREGHFEIRITEFEDLIKDLNSKDALFKFLDLHYFHGGENKVKILPVKETKEMIIYLFLLIDNIKVKNERDTRNFNWTDQSIYLEINETRELINYHTRFLNKVDQYYGGIKGKNGQVLFDKNERIKGLISYEPSERNLSSGETALLNFYSRIYYYFQKNIFELESTTRKDFYIIFLDEAEMGFHPKWKKAFVKSITSFLPNFFKSIDAHIQIIFTTHDALTLSDIPNTQITYLDKTLENNIVLNELNKPQRSFGANITDLLSDSFFISNGLIGDFAKGIINETIYWINYRKLESEIVWLSKEEKPNNQIIKTKKEELKILKKNLIERSKEDYFKIINLIDEPVLKIKLLEMYSEIFDDKNKILEDELKFMADKLGFNISPKSKKK